MLKYESLAGKRVLVVGASSGLGKAIGLALCEQGVRTAFAARRRDRLEEIVSSAGGETLAIECDVRDPEACERVVETTVDAFGGLDGLVYSSGVVYLGDIAAATAEDWRRSLETNVIGAALTTRAALPHLKAVHGCAVYLSSIAALDFPPRPGNALYVSSKLALNGQIHCWQTEHRDVRFTRVSVGDTDTSEASANWNPDDAAAYVPKWVGEDFMFGRVMSPETIASQVMHVLACPEWVQELTIKPHYPYE